MPNFILIGMPASGKSTLGKMAAAALQYNFVDTDDTIIAFLEKNCKFLFQNPAKNNGFRADVKNTCNCTKNVL